MSGQILSGAQEIGQFLLSLEGRMPGEDVVVRDKVAEIIAAVRKGGESAVLEMRERFEGVAGSEPLVLSAEGSPAAFQNFLSLASKVPEALREAVTLSVRRVRNYHNIQCDQDRLFEDRTGLPVGGSHAPVGQFVSRVQPLDRVAVYVPGGKAFYPSSLVMTVVPAQVAGVQSISVVTPFRSLENPAFAATCLALGVTEILATGGAQGVAAAAFGFGSFQRCDKIVGPGNAFVATAKHLLSGRIGIDSFAGPSEILVLSDGSSPAEWVAADLLAQAEHDEEASAVLVTTSASEAEAVKKCILDGFAKLGERGKIARSSWERYGAIILVSSDQEQIAIANRMHAEHLHIHAESALTPDGRSIWAQQLRGVGAVFFGRYCAEVFGDYIAGPSHVLPTAGTARFASPLGVYDFLRRSSLLWMTQSLAADLAGPTAVFADAEQLWGHALAARLRAPQSPHEPTEVSS